MLWPQSGQGDMGFAVGWETRASTASVPAELCHVPCASCVLEPGKGTLSKQSLHGCHQWQPSTCTEIRQIWGFGMVPPVFQGPPELCLGRAALRAGRCLWLRDRALQSCHCLWQCLWQCLQGGWCQAGMIPAGAVALLLSEQLGLEQSCWFLGDLSTW